ncbi:MAG: type I-B CRISPR-associated protein Cas8b1/Cst1 [Bacteroidaceae bacterium]|nr:type I-B CRISPR-associated protein Cas8b1/Cst1 [Bacteroidaceae bacterium]
MRDMCQADYDALIAPTGDPFVDAGGFVLEKLSQLFPEKDILELIMWVTDIYVDKWNAGLNALFLNSKITQPSFKEQRKKEETRRYFQDLLDDKQCHEIGFCRITGRKVKLFAAGRDNSVLTGSRKFANFHHGFDAGIMLSKEVLIKYHFLPLACESLLGHICVISSNNVNTSRMYATNCLERNLANISKGVSDGILKNKSRSAGTALFRFLDQVFVNYSQEGYGESMTLYHFTNFGASPDMQMFVLPFPVFRFYRETQNRKYKESWNRFVAHYYRTKDYKKFEYDDASTFIQVTDKNNRQIEISQQEYGYWTNAIYNKLLLGNSIVCDIRKWSEEKEFDLMLLFDYLLNIRNMKRETIEKINQIADFILQIHSDLSIGKLLTRLNGIKSAYLLRRFILKIVEENYKQGNELPIITVQEYTDYLFPDTSLWSETRDILLICLYQKLHEKNIHVEVEDGDDDNDFVDDND